MRLNNLEVLSLYGNELDSIPHIIFSSRKLRKLDLGFNKIRVIDSSIAKLDNLELFSLPNNELSAMPEEMGALSKLKYLYLPGNQMETLPLSISTLPLEEIDMEFNKLRTIPACIFGMRELEGLYISNNLVEILPRAFLSMVNLKALYIDGNRIELDGIETSSIIRELEGRCIELKY